MINVLYRPQRNPTRNRNRSHLVPDPAERRPVVENPGMRPRVVGGVMRGKDAGDQKHKQQSSPRPTPAEPVGDGQQRKQPKRREPDEPPQAAGAAAVVPIDLGAGE